MKKNLEDWLRGDVPHPAGTVPPSDVSELKFPVVPFLSLPLLPVREPLPTPSSELPEDLPFVDFMKASVDEPPDVPLFDPGAAEGEKEDWLPEAQEQEPTEKAEGSADVPQAPPQQVDERQEPDLFAPLSFDAEEDVLQAHDIDRYDHEEDDEDKNAHIYEEKHDDSFGPAHASESPEQDAARFAEQLRRITQMRRISGATGRRPGFRGNRGRLFTLCVLLILIAGTVYALWKHMQHNSFDSLMADADEQYRQEQYESAFDIYSNAASRYPARLEPLLGMAHSAEQTGRIEPAIEAYAAIMRVLPADASGSRSGAFYETGRLYAILKNRDAAQENFEKAVQLDGTNYNAFFALGSILEERGDLEKALPNYRRALDLSPSSDAAAGAVKRVADQLNAEREDAASAAAEARKYEQAMQTGSIALGLKRYDEASQRFAEALAIRSDDATAWVGFADARKALGDTAGAVKSLQRALERDPQNVDAQTKLDALTKTEPKKAPAPKKTPTRKKTKTAPRSSAPPSAGDRRAAATTRRELFETGVERYRAGAYTEAFEFFLACLRSPGRDPLPDLPVAGDVGPLWRGYRAQLRIPSDMRRLSEALSLNPNDHDLYLNLSLAGTRIKMDRKTLRETINDIWSHAQARR